MHNGPTFTRDLALFDLGGVLLDPAGVLPRIAHRLQVDAGELAQAYAVNRAAYDLRMPAEDYWAGVIAALPGSARSRPGVKLVRELVEMDNSCAHELVDGAYELLESVSRAGTRLGVLSNAPRSMAAQVTQEPWFQLMEQAVFSGVENVAKPQVEMYRRTANTFSCRPDQITFFDDRAENVAAAGDFGISAHMWRGVADARAVLESRGLV